MGDESMVGQSVGPYRVVTSLGEGGTGEVYYAEHDRIGRRVAVKFLRDVLCTDEGMVKRFFDEARAVNDIRHPNIVQITDCGELSGRPYLVMELLEGMTLGERMESSDPLSEEQVFRWMSEAASALGAAHEHQIVHRDIKPENIFLCQHPDGSHYVKLLDFGIAKLLDGGLNVGSQTATGVFMGTPRYMSPEQCMSQPNLDGRSDVYSLAVVLYEMLSGVPPFEGDTLGPLLMAHVNQEPMPLRQRRKEISAEAEALVHRALAKNPRDRFATMHDMRAAMQKVGKKRAAPADRTNVMARVQQERTSLDGEQVRSERVANKLAGIIEERVRTGTLNLPVMPTAVTKGIAMLDDENVPLREVALALEEDPLLATQVLKVANSPMFMGAEAAATLGHAVSRLGASNLRAVLVESSARALFQSRVASIRRDMQRIWDHSVAVACLTREISDLRDACTDSATAYLSGLLHDVGKPIVGALLLDIEKYMAKREKQFMDHDMWLRVVSESHRQVGMAVADAWHLNADVKHAIQGTYQLDESVPRSLANCVCLANAIAKRELPFAGTFDHEANDDLIERGVVLLSLETREVAELVETCHDLSAA